MRLPWAALLCGMILCLGCPRTTPTSLTESPEAFLHKVEVRMQAGLDMLYFSAVVEQYHDLCTVLYPVLTETLEEGYDAFRQRNGLLYNAAVRYVMLPVAFAPFIERAERERIERLANTWIPAQAKSTITAYLQGLPAAQQYSQCTDFKSDVLAGEYDAAKHVPQAAKVIQDAEAEVARWRREQRNHNGYRRNRF
jgi:hypothetical protein